ncbi:hypothetical protein QQS21_005502 [Conoideocrella luteorostrata]|uniref:Carboxylic ester hydrolase n=1 Tax=Conoideocrella luteorostrata TaxID=1105319 RepID=A0AAJ0CRU0_9HYPO|nr:hypothetical protein QQS21_005502 [Conoideocrella luteorostrata]
MPPQPLSIANATYNNGILNATALGSTCIQWHKTFAWEDPQPSEDCLYLNVYVPANSKTDAALPVKVFAFGGGNNAGAANFPLYDSCSLATDSIVVTFNYRLGPLGFMALEKAGIGGNMAIQDYLAALQWVQQSITRFGGDARKVMLFGQSAGAADSFVVSTLPDVKDLVMAVGLESGGGQDLTPNDLAQEVGESYAQTLGCKADDLRCLQAKSVKHLLEARPKIPALQQNGPSLGSEFGLNIPNRRNLNSAVLDGKIVKDQPLQVGSKVPILTGFNQYDSTLFVVPLFKDRSTVTEKNYSDFLNQWGDNGAVIGKQYPLSQFTAGGVSTADAVVNAITRITTAAGFMCPVYRNLRATTAAGTPAFSYRFNHTPSCSWLWTGGMESPSSKHLPLYKSAHTSELAFVFNGLVNQPWGNGSCNATATEHGISASMVAAWTAMAAKGDPSTSKLQWPSFAANDTRGLDIGQDGVGVGAIDYSECNFWDGIWAKLGGVNISSTAQNNSGRAVSNDKDSSADAVGLSYGGGAFTGVLSSMVMILGLLL